METKKRIPGNQNENIAPIHRQRPKEHFADASGVPDSVGGSRQGNIGHQRTVNDGKTPR